MFGATEQHGPDPGPGRRSRPRPVLGLPHFSGQGPRSLPTASHSHRDPHNLRLGPSPASVEKSKRVSQFEGMLSPAARSLLLREESPPEFGGPQSPGRPSQEEVTLYWRIRPRKERDHLCTCPTGDPLQGNCESRRGKGRGRWAKKGPLQWVNQCGSSGLGGTQTSSLVHSWAIQSLSESLLSAYSGPGGRLGRQR